MKKSYDYFKTLKNLSLILSNTISFIDDSKSVNKEYLCFLALKNELSENLINEFVAPIERNDIYKLSFCLNEEFSSIFKLCNFLDLSDADYSDSVRQIGDLFYRQDAVFDIRNLLKTPDKSLKFISNELLNCKKVKKSIIVETHNNLCSQNRTLIKYIIGSSGIDVVSSVEKTYNEVCAVLINNS